MATLVREGKAKEVRWIKHSTAVSKVLELSQNISDNNTQDFLVANVNIDKFGPFAKYHARTMAKMKLRRTCLKLGLSLASIYQANIPNAVQRRTVLLSDSVGEKTFRTLAKYKSLQLGQTLGISDST